MAETTSSVAAGGAGAPPPSRDRGLALGAAVAAAALALITVATFLPALACGFVAWDDLQTVRDYAPILDGLSGPGIAWAFRHSLFGHWIPLTVLSHMADWQLFGADARGHHLTSVLLHAANVVLVLLFWQRGTGRTWRSAAVAALWGLHPLRVQPVVWVATRKDVLAGLFVGLTLLAYLEWRRRRTSWSYLAMGGALALALLAKPIAVTVPLLLLLLDWWPLERWGIQASAEAHNGAAALVRRGVPVLVEKLPLMALAAAAAVLALLSQGDAGAVSDLAAVPLGLRLGNALVSIPRYLAMTFVPAGLLAFYPLPTAPPPWPTVALAALGVAAVTALALVRARRAPWLAVGWLWFLVTLLPVLGLVQVGDQSHADRCTYLPAIGLTMALVWEGAELAMTRPRLRRLLAAAAVLLAACSVAATRREIPWWRDTPTLFGHMVALQPDNHVGHLNLATWLAKEGRIDEAVPHLRRTIELRPNLALAHANLGSVLRRQGDLAGAQAELGRAIQLSPALPSAHFQLAMVYADEGKNGLAIGHLAEVIGLSPRYPGAWLGLRWLLARPGAPEQAVPYVDAVARRHPRSAELQRLLSALRKRSRAARAIAPAPLSPGRP